MVRTVALPTTPKTNPPIVPQVPVQIEIDVAPRRLPRALGAVTKCVHFLAIGPATLETILKVNRIAKKDIRAIKQHLNSVASCNDNMYELKEEEYLQINPELYPYTYPKLVDIN